MRHPEAQEVCNRVDDDCDGTTDEGETIVPLAPGTYGLESAHVRLVGLADMWLPLVQTIGDATGDGADDFITNSLCDGASCLGLHAAGFCSEPFDTSEWLAEFPVTVSGYAGAIGDLDLNGLADLTVAGRIYLSPLSGFQSKPDLVVPGVVTAMAAADLDGDGISDLVVGDTTDAAVRFHRGPFENGDVGTPVTLTGPGFGKALALLPRADPSLSFIGADSSVWVVEGVPAEDGPGAARRLDLEPLFPLGQPFIGRGLTSDGEDRVCIGAEDSGRVVCGTLAQLDAQAPGQVIEARDGTSRSGMGASISMTRDLVAVGHRYATVNGADGTGIVYVRAEQAQWDFEGISPPAGEYFGGFGQQVALLRDPVHDLTWLAVAAPNEEPGGVIYIFALDVSPTM